MLLKIEQKHVQIMKHHIDVSHEINDSFFGFQLNGCRDETRNVTSMIRCSNVL